MRAARNAGQDGVQKRRGDGRGRSIGVPTANLRLLDEKLVPADGIYAVFDLPPDTYRVRIASCGSEPFVPQFYDGASDLGSATPIPLSVGKVRSDIDAALQPGGP